MMTEVVYITCSNWVGMNVQKLFAPSRPLKRPDPLSVKKETMRDRSGHNTVGTLTRHLGTIRSGLCRRCSSGRATEATQTSKVQPFDFVVSFLKTREA